MIRFEEQLLLLGVNEVTAAWDDGEVRARDQPRKLLGAWERSAEIGVRHLEVELEVVATNRRVNVVEEGFDLAVMFMDVNDDSSLVARKLESAEHRCCASPAYIATHGVPKSPEDVRSHSCIVYGESRQAVWRFERGEDKRRVAIHGRMSVNSFLMAHDAALRGAPDGRSSEMADRLGGVVLKRQGKGWADKKASI
jgi:DNA-binding transcriptional LysR family regulator